METKDLKFLKIDRELTSIDINNSTKFHLSCWKRFLVIVRSVDDGRTDERTTVYHDTARLRRAYKTEGPLINCKTKS